MDFLSLFNNAKKIISGGKESVTPDFDVSNLTPNVTKGIGKQFNASDFSKSISKPFKNPNDSGIYNTLKSVIPGLDPLVQSIKTKSLKPEASFLGDTMKKYSFTAMGKIKKENGKISFENPEQAKSALGNITGLVMGSVGNEASLVKNLAKEKSVTAVESMLKGRGLSTPQVINIAPKIAASRSEQEILQFIRNAKSAGMAEANMVNQPLKQLKSFNDFKPEIQNKLIAFSDAVKNKQQITPETITSLQKFFTREGLTSPKTAKKIASQIDIMQQGVLNAGDTVIEAGMSARAAAGIDPRTAWKNQLIQDAKEIILKGKQAMVEQPRTTIGRFDYKTKNPIANITAPTTKTSSRIIDNIIAPKAPVNKSLVDKAKDFWKGLPNKQGGFADFGVGSNRDFNKIKQQALADSPAKDLNKYFGKSSDTISQQLENYKGTERARFIQDKVSELGYSNIDEAQVALDSYRKSRSIRYSSEGIPLATPASMKARLGKQTIPEQVGKSISPTKSIPEIVGGTGEIRSLEKTAQRALGEDNVRNLSNDARSFTKSISQIPGLSPKQKVNIVDTYLRTPNKVAKKIGLENEFKNVEKAQEAYQVELKSNLSKVGDWEKQVPGKDSNTKIFDYLDGKNIDLTDKELKVATEIKVWLRTWADRLGLPADSRIEDYITHLIETDKEFPNEVARIIDETISKSVWNPFLLKRTGAVGYKRDVWAALDAYVKRGTRKVHMDPVLTALEDKVSPTNVDDSVFQYVKRYTDNVNMHPSANDKGLDNFAKSIVGNLLGQRPTAAVTHFIRQWVYRAGLYLNPTSFLKNLSQGANTYAELGEKYTAVGYSKLFNKASWKEINNSGIFLDSFVQDRQMSAVKKTWEKIDKVGFALFQLAERINRGAAYFGAKAKGLAQGMTEDSAITYAKDIVEKTQFKFGATHTPVGLNSDIAKVFTQYQTYTLKQGEFLADKLMKKEWAGLARYIGAGLAFVYTVGSAFGMKPSDLIPSANLGVPASLKLPAAVVGAVANTPDKYGNERTAGQKVSDIGKSALGYLPGYSQGKKTLEGYQAIKQGGSYDAAGRLQFPVGQSPIAKAQALLFGKYSSSEAQDYFNRGEISKEEKAKVQPAFDQVQALAKSGQNDEAVAVYNSLSDADKATYKKIQSVEKAKINQQGKKDILSTFNQVQNMTKSGDKEGALTLYNGLNDTQKKYYKMVLDDQKRVKTASNGDKPTFDPNTTTSTNSVLDTVWAYAKALGTDPVTAFNRIFTGQKIRYVTNGTIVVERLPLAESQAEKKAQGSTGSEVKLDHTIPLQLGGSNSKDNLKLVPTGIWESYTPVEDTLGKALRNGKITKAVAQSLIKDFKEGNITSQDVYSSISGGEIKSSPRIKSGQKYSEIKSEADIQSTKDEVMKNYPFSPLAKNYINQASISKLKNSKNDVLINGATAEGGTTPKGADFSNFVVKHIAPFSEKLSDFILNHTGLLQNLDKANIEIQNTDPVVLAHEMLHQYFQNSPLAGKNPNLTDNPNAEKFGTQFLDIWDSEKQREPDSPLAMIDANLERDYNLNDMSGEDIASEKFAYLGELVGQYGIDVIPQHLRQFYKQVFKSK